MSHWRANTGHWVLFGLDVLSSHTFKCIREKYSFNGGKLSPLQPVKLSQREDTESVSQTACKVEIMNIKFKGDSWPG